MNERPICDICAKVGDRTKVRMEIHLVDDPPGQTFGCAEHNRFYNAIIGYQPFDQQKTQPIYPCPQGCGKYMYISSFESDIPQLKCPECDHQPSLHF